MLAVDPLFSEIARRRAEANLALEKLQRIAAQADASAARAKLSDPEAQYDDAKRSNVRMQELLKRKAVTPRQGPGRVPV